MVLAVGKKSEISLKTKDFDPWFKKATALCHWVIIIVMVQSIVDILRPFIASKGSCYHANILSCLV